MNETKELLAINLFLAVTIVGTLVACYWERARDIIAFLIAGGALVTERLDVNFVSRFWYRGTTRGFEVSLIDALAVCLLLSLILKPRVGQPRWFMPASLLAILAYFGWCCVSVATSEPQLLGMFELSKIVRTTIVFVAVALYVRGERELRVLLWALACALTLEGAVCLKHKLWWRMDRPFGTLGHPNSVSMYLCLVTPVLFAAANSEFPRRLRWACGAAVGIAMVTILLTVSRAGIPIFFLVVAGTAAFCLTWRITWKKVAAACAACVVLGAVLFVTRESLVARYASASLSEEYSAEGFENRGVYIALARHMIADHPLGVGLNNWSYWVGKEYAQRINVPYADYEASLRRAALHGASPTDGYYYDGTYAPPAHSLAVITLGELGWPGFVLLFGFVWMRWFLMGASFLKRRSTEVTHRIGVGIFFGVLGVFLQGLTEWTFRHSAIQYTAMLLIGTLAALYQLKRAPVAVAQRERKMLPEEVTA